MDTQTETKFPLRTYITSYTEKMGAIKNTELSGIVMVLQEEWGKNNQQWVT